MVRKGRGIGMRKCAKRRTLAEPEVEWAQWMGGTPPFLAVSFHRVSFPPIPFRPGMTKSPCTVPKTLFGTEISSCGCIASYGEERRAGAMGMAPVGALILGARIVEVLIAGVLAVAGLRSGMGILTRGRGS